MRMHCPHAIHWVRKDHSAGDGAVKYADAIQTEYADRRRRQPNHVVLPTLPDENGTGTQKHNRRMMIQGRQAPDNALAYNDVIQTQCAVTCITQPNHVTLPTLPEWRLNWCCRDSDRSIQQESLLMRIHCPDSPHWTPNTFCEEQCFVYQHSMHRISNDVL